MLHCKQSWCSTLLIFVDPCGHFSLDSSSGRGTAPCRAQPCLLWCHHHCDTMPSVFDVVTKVVMGYVVFFYYSCRTQIICMAIYLEIFSSLRSTFVHTYVHYHKKIKDIHIKNTYINFSVFRVTQACMLIKCSNDSRGHYYTKYLR